MLRKEYIKIINEEISNFDYLGNDDYAKEQELINLLKTEEFQKQFICDVLLRKPNIKKKVTHARIGGDYEDDDPSYVSLEYFLDYEYQYDINKEEIKFTIDFSADKISINVYSNTDRGDYYTPPSTEAYYTDVEWLDIEVTMHTLDGDDIDFIAFNKAPIKIQELFIRENVENFISSETFDTSELGGDKIQSISYC